MFHDMFHMQLPLLEKILRPMIVYLALILLLRVFGKRELAQLNPFDLVVLLSLSNTVQNAIIGDDNSISGGIIGAVALLSINWVVVRLLYGSPKMNEALGGTERVLVLDGVADEHALKRELLTEEELLSVLHRQGFDSLNDVARCVLEPNGTFYVEGRRPSMDEDRQRELIDRLEILTREVQALRTQISGAS
ncbi:DUF421 domain-containing protein [Paracidobacterium acidisoli]|uniref:DUF421 domain-containing protein n=1 Tax=Paracidobacterium acidisoli TaxID=2303751 RepID=A0A372ITR9_9BACT|nr:YetF domain-containing protein [Paracidobacterium acidisoli]MBT9329604.1 DUF421 domain-containing protein [Paracidobacterium acidisoli]